MEKEREEALYQNENVFADCLSCNGIKEMPDFTASRICNDCGGPVFITAG